MGILKGSGGSETFIHTENYKPRQMKMALKLKMSDVYCGEKMAPIRSQQKSKVLSTDVSPGNRVMFLHQLVQLVLLMKNYFHLNGQNCMLRSSVVCETACRQPLMQSIIAGIKDLNE